VEIINQTYGKTLDEIERTMGRIIPAYFLDPHGFIYAYINRRTLKPFQDDDSEVNVKPVHENWIANGSFPYELKRTYLTYEDSDMAAGDYLMALMSRHRKTRDAETEAKAHAFFRTMVKLWDTVAEKNPYGAGFLPKPYGGIGRAHESFETSADQYFKFTAALVRYSRWTSDAHEQAKVSDILLSFARWLDDRDFVTPYMGNPNYGRLVDLMHCLGYFAYIMALGCNISGHEHFRQEALFFLDRMLKQRRLSGSVNSMNLVVEELDGLIELMPEYRAELLGLMARDWEHRGSYVDADGTARFEGYIWNNGARLASTHNTITKHFPEQKAELDLKSLLLHHNTVDRFVHQVGSDRPDDMTYYEHRFCLEAQSYACWLRGYWESDLSK
jgi:hypothetical protein